MMTPEQLLKLQEMGEKVFDSVLVEVNPSNWTGGGRAPKDLSQNERGDAVWCRKQAVASLALLTKFHEITHGDSSRLPPVSSDPPDDVDQDVNDALRDGERLLKRLHSAE